MNSLKNAIVTITLLAVGYGAYVVLNDPSAPGLTDILEPDQQVTPLGEAGQTVDFEPEISLGSPSAPPASPPSLPAADAPQVDAPHHPGLTLGSDTRVDTTSPPAPITLSAATTGPTTGAATTGAATDPLPEPGSEPGQRTGLEASVPALTAASSGDTYRTGPDPSRGSQRTDSDTLQPKSTGSNAFTAAWRSAQDKLARGQLADALFTLSIWFDDPDVPTYQMDDYVRLLDQLAGTVIYSRQHLLEPPHLVQSNETLADIARQYHIPPSMLARINGIDPAEALAPGTRLKAVRGPFRGEVSLARRELTLFVGRYYAGRFPIGLGRDLPDREAVYEVAEKAFERPYFDRLSGRELPPGHPENPYGSYWLGLRGDAITAAHSVALHATASQAATADDNRGCIGLSARDAGDVYAILSVGSRITVRR